MTRESAKRSKHLTVTEHVRHNRRRRYKLLQANVRRDLDLPADHGAIYGAFSDAISSSHLPTSQITPKLRTSRSIKSKHRPPLKLRALIRPQASKLKTIKSSGKPTHKVFSKSKGHHLSENSLISQDCQLLQNVGSHSKGYWSGASGCDLLNDSMSNLSIHEDSLSGIPWSTGEDEDMNGGRKPSYLSLGDLKINSMSTIHKVVNDVQVLIPSKSYHIPPMNGPGSPPLEEIITIETLNLNIAAQCVAAGLRLFQVSPAISIQPSTVTFCALYPAVIHVPLSVCPSSGDEVHCLFSESSVVDQSLPTSRSGIHNWVIIEECTVKEGKAVFETFRFGVFVLVIRPKSVYRSLPKNIKANEGGFLDIPGFPAIQVVFPRNVTTGDMRANAKVHFDIEKSLSEFLEDSICTGSSPNEFSLATPIIQLEPHGTQFGNDPVLITLPVPDYNKIMSIFGSTVVLSVWQSNTHPNEPSRWEELHVKYAITYVKINGEEIALLTFPVSHFSCFKGIWNIALKHLCQKGIGMMNFFVSFVMTCRAYMEEFPSDAGSVDTKEKDTECAGNGSTPGGNRFGLQVLVYSGQDKEPSPHLRMFQHKVGQALPKLVKPGGKMETCLRSNFFEPDRELAEDEEMFVEEPYFYGQDFDAQYVCRFKSGVNIDKGLFGQVSVSRHVPSHPLGQEIFKFKLVKRGNEDQSADLNTNDWTMIRLTDLADTFAVTEGSNWKKFAKHLGVTNEDIYELGLTSDDHPFEKLVDLHMQRGGSSKSIVDALYKYSRKLDNSGPSSGQTRRFKRCSAGSSGFEPSSGNVHSSSRRRSCESDTSAKSYDSGMRSKEGSPCSPSMESRNTNDHTKLTNAFLWKASELLNCPQWKFVGRSLGLGEEDIMEINDNRAYAVSGNREKAHQMLLQWKQRFPRRCTYRHLFSALRNHGMNEKARKLGDISMDSSHV